MNTTETFTQHIILDITFFLIGSNSGIRTILNMAKSLIKEKGLPQKLWGEAV